MIRVKDLTVRCGERTVLDRVSLTIPDTGLTYLSGPSGVGKTTLLRVLAGLLEPERGRISLPGRPILLFQEDRLFPHLSARKQVEGVLPKEKRGLAVDFLALVGLREDAEKLPGELSGGMARRLALARCLALGGERYLLDEPFAGVDPERQKRIFQALRELGKPVVLTGHQDWLANAADRVVEV